MQVLSRPIKLTRDTIPELDEDGMPYDEEDILRDPDLKWEHYREVHHDDLTFDNSLLVFPHHAPIPHRTVQQSFTRQQNIRILVDNIRAAEMSDDQDKLMPSAVARHVVKTDDKYLSMLAAWADCSCHVCSNRLAEIKFACEKWLGEQAFDDDMEWASANAVHYVAHAIRISDSEPRAKMVHIETFVEVWVLLRPLLLRTLDDLDAWGQFPALRKEISAQTYGNLSIEAERELEDVEECINSLRAHHESHRASPDTLTPFASLTASCTALLKNYFNGPEYAKTESIYTQTGAQSPWLTFGWKDNVLNHETEPFDIYMSWRSLICHVCVVLGWVEGPKVRVRESADEVGREMFGNEAWEDIKREEKQRGDSGVGFGSSSDEDEEEGEIVELVADLEEVHLSPVAKKKGRGKG